MKTIGLIGGMSWESSLEYYRIINEVVKLRLGGFHSAKSVMVSVDFSEVETMQIEGQWDAAGRLLAASAQQLEHAGADFVLLCTNTMHKVAGAIQAAIEIPFLHIADASAIAIKAAGLKTVGLLGTRFTMEQDFYRGHLATQHDLSVIIPDEEERADIHRAIYDELVLGVINPDSRRRYQSVINSLVERGAEGMILGCTEIGLLIKQADSPVPVFDTTQIHAETAVEWALQGV